MPRSRHVGRLGLITALGLVAAPLVALPAASATDLFFSEYVEGSSNNKALEIYNNTGASVALNGYNVDFYFNGATTSRTVALSGTVADGDVFILADNDASAAILAEADQTDTGSFFNGDDAIALSRGGTVLDVIGQIGTDPGAEWGAGLTSTADNTLRRKATIDAGDPDGSNAFDPAAQWDGYPQDTFDGLGAHPGTPPDEEPPPVDLGDCGDEATLISAVQGSGASTPLAGDTVVVEAVVTSIKNGLSGYYVQEELADSDGNPETSEGVFVFTGSGDNSNVTVGQLVRVAGMAGEFTLSGSQQTQLTDPEVLVCGAAPQPIEATEVTFPLDAADDLEHYEGMLAVLTDTLVISEYFNYDRFGEVVLAKPIGDLDRLFTPTAVVEPGPEAVALAEEYTRRIITLDDFNSNQNPVTIPHPGNGEPFSTQNLFRGGDTVTGVEGVIDDTFGLYRIQPTEYGEYKVENPRPEGAPDVGGDVQVASFNVLNYFLSLDDGPADCGPGGDQDCRGANSQAELERQRAKILAALAELDADVVGLIEMENTTGVEPAADLVAGLNAMLGDGTYDYIDTGVIGTDAIRVGFLYKPGAVAPVGDYAVLDSSVDSRFDDTRNRPMLTQTFDEVASGERFTVSVNHLKSKGSGCGEGDDATDGSGNCDLTRTLAAEAIADYLEGDPTGSDDPDQLVIGDLNSYDHERPIDALVAAGYTDLIKKFGGEFAYGYVFDGQVGYLDYGLSNESLTPQVTGAQEWHINADEPDILDYNLDFGRPATYFTPDEFRSSDHDAVLVGLDLVGEEEPPPTTCFGLEPTIVSDGRVVFGTNRADVILVGDGTVTVFGGNGNDVICVGDGSNQVFGGNGDDRVLTGDGDSLVFGENGNDEVVTGDGDNLVFGENGNDRITTGEGDDVIFGGNGRDVIDAGEGDNLVFD